MAPEPSKILTTLAHVTHTDTHTRTQTGATVTGSLVCKVCAHTSLPACLDSSRLEGALDFDRLALGPSLFASLQHGAGGTRHPLQTHCRQYSNLTARQITLTHTQTTSESQLPLQLPLRRQTNNKRERRRKRARERERERGKHCANE